MGDMKLHPITNVRSFVKGFTGGSLIVGGYTGGWGIGSTLLMVFGILLMLDTFMPFRQHPYILTGIIGTLAGGLGALLFSSSGLLIPYTVFVFLLLAALYSDSVYEWYEHRAKRPHST